MTPLRVAGCDGRFRIKAWRSALVAASCAGCLFGFVVAPASAQQESLNGVAFNDPNVQISNVQCQIDGRSTFDFRATGVIERPPFPPFPPYSEATWTETGSVVIGPQVRFNSSSGQLFPDGPWVKLTASFTMTATDGTVIKGTKKLTDATYDFPYNEAVCVAFPIPTAPDVTSGYAWGGTSNRLKYEATITGPPGTKTKCKDRGDAYLTFADATYVWMGAPQVFRSFFELFTATSFKC
jgi:hypothetical protein